MENLTQKELNNKNMTVGGRDKIINICKKLNDRVRNLEEIDENLEKLIKKCQMEGFSTSTSRSFQNQNQNFDLKSLISGFDEIISSPLGQEIDRTLTKKIISNLTVLRNGFGVEFLGRDGSELDKLLKCCQFDYRHKNLFRIQN